LHFDALQVDVEGSNPLVDVEAALDRAGLKNVQVREYVRFWVELTGPGGSRSSEPRTMPDSSGMH
jgi:hypothetical protein